MDVKLAPSHFMVQTFIKQKHTSWIFFTLSLIGDKKWGAMLNVPKYAAFFSPQVNCFAVSGNMVWKTVPMFTWLVAVMTQVSVCCLLQEYLCFTSWCWNFTAECFKCRVEISPQGRTWPELWEIFMPWTKGEKIKSKQNEDTAFNWPLTQVSRISYISS